MQTVTRVKICGLTNAADVRAACDAGADALGLNFVKGSPRYIGGDLAKASEVIASVPPFVWRVGIFDAVPLSGAVLSQLHAVQYYAAGAETRVFRASDRPAPFAIKAFRVRGESSLEEIARDAGPRDAILLDAYSPNALGGTGHTFNWELAVEAKRRFRLPIILAGGLTAENVGDAVATVHPAMVDVSSGVETAPGIKDHEKMRLFIRAVRDANGA